MSSTTNTKTEVQPKLDLGTEKIGKLLARFAIPGITSMVVNALYNIVDQIFIGQGVGYLGNGATNVIFPLSTFAMAFALLIGDGSASFMSLMLGKKEERKAARGTVAGMISIVIAGVIMMCVYLTFLEPLCRLFGATDAILPYALQYGSITAIGIPFCSVCAGWASIIRADGSPKYNMIGLLTGCAINLIGDPIFIFVFHWGVAGAAWATILGQIANALINVAYIPRFKAVKIHKDDVRHCWGTLGSVLKLGVSSFISQMVLVVVMAVQNNLLRTYGALSEYGEDIPISALGVTMKVFSILAVIVIGLAAGAQPIWGYNYGAKLYSRVQKTLGLVTKISTGVMIFAFILFQFFPLVVLRIFGTQDPMYTKFSVKTLRIFLLLIPVAGFQLSAGIFFQAVGKPLQASLISLSKQILFSIPIMLILSPIKGIDGILWSGPISDALSFALTIVMMRVSWKSIFRPGEGLEREELGNAGLTAGEATAASSSGKYLIAGCPTVVTIDRSYGAGGRQIGKQLAEQLGVPYYDTDIITEAAEESGLSAMFLASVDESTGSAQPLSAVTNYSAFATSSGLTVVQQAAEEAQCAVIEKVAHNGACVIVGRRADQILKGTSPVFRVFITMPLEQRIVRVSKSELIAPEEAEKRIRKTDKRRSEFYNFTGDGKWGQAENYDLCLDAGKTGSDGAVQIIRKTLGA